MSTFTSPGSGTCATLIAASDAPSYLTMLMSLGSSWTHRLITAKDHASVQINVGNVDAATGRYTGDFKTYAICGYIRSKVRHPTNVCAFPTRPTLPHRPFSERERHGVHSAHCRGRGCAGTEALNASRKTRSHMLSIGSRFSRGVDYNVGSPSATSERTFRPLCRLRLGLVAQHRQCCVCDGHARMWSAFAVANGVALRQQRSATFLEHRLCSNLLEVGREVKLTSKLERHGAGRPA